MHTLISPFPLDALWTCVVLAMVVSGTSNTITGTDIFEPLRRFLAARSSWLGHLIACFYCTSHWIAFFLVALCRPVLVETGFAPVDLAVSAFFVIQLATFFTGVLFKSFSIILPVKAAMREAMQQARAMEASEPAGAPPRGAKEAT
ncbi:hypothetical protein [Anaeromyxobacter sp. Fw109-5]|uniref:hypothetical protein n=1 Tax=Anaeromyxobacter sp. (strain Fw109-5) TaxID=404589 RepID=UPI0000ED704C|nr:hypothetical protein [Anaeromyxobacter sp. Fw109-5]ABS27843.1 conserved hypothetical protein [Anaeromyxobacter sp. Fw109-5]